MTWFELLGKIAMSDHNEFAEKMQGVYRAVTQFSEKVTNLYDSLNAWWNDTGIYVCKAIYELAAPFYDEEKRQKLIDCYKGWGKFGWTVNSKATSAMFSMLPSTQTEADNIMQQYCTIENVAEMQQTLIEHGVNQQDLNEAFLCYKNGMYKASSLILFALIDNKLIGLGYRKTKKNGIPGRLKVGESAAKTFYEQKQDDFAESFLFNNLWFLNIMECLVKLFADTNDFQNDEDMINRNYVSHGMSQRDVTEIDCFKVWSALYSWTALLPHLEEATE